MINWKATIKSRTLWGLAIAALAFLAGPDALQLVGEIFGTTPPMWVTKVLGAASVLYAAYGRMKATEQLVDQEKPIERPVELR